MTYSLEDFCADARASLKEKAGSDARQAIKTDLERLLTNADFVAEHAGPEAEAGIRTIYRDAETGMNVLVHVYAESKAAPPHDHGDSWAVYCQAVLHTDMTVWQRTDDGGTDGKASVEPVETFRLEPGMAGVFEPGQIHSLSFPAGARFVRVTGTDLKTIATRRFDPDAGTVLEDKGVSGVAKT